MRDKAGHFNKMPIIRQKRTFRNSESEVGFQGIGLPFFENLNATIRTYKAISLRFCSSFQLKESDNYLMV